MIKEGTTVSYVGLPADDLELGDRGKVLSQTGEHNHVVWRTGKRKGEIVIVADSVLVPYTQKDQIEASLDESFESGRLITVSVRETYDSGGGVALLNALNEEGHLATFASIAEQALQMVSKTIREDPSIKEVLADLEPDEGDHFVSLAASVLLRDAFGGEAE